MAKKLKRVLLLGSSGMAGQVLKVEFLKHRNIFDLVDVARTTEVTIPKIVLDVTDWHRLRDIVIQGDFDFIVNCIGLLNNDAENNADQAILLNSYLPQYIANLTKDTKTRVVHISTDCVFSGKKGNYKENDLKDGVGFYAQSKALGEICNSKDLTIRTSIIGPDLNLNGLGLFNWFIKQSGSVNGYSNAFWSGVTTLELAKFILEIVHRKTPPVGLLHLTNNLRISKFNLLRLIHEVFELKGIEIIEYSNYKVDKSFISTRDDLDYEVKSYRDMIIEMRVWMLENNYLKSNKNYESI